MKKRYDGILLCSDFDRTLSSHNFEWIEGGAIIDAVPKNNITAIRYFVENGGTFVIVSGRNPDEICSLYDYFPFEDLFIASNGTVIYSGKQLKAVKSYTLSDDFVEIPKFLYNKVPEFAYFRITDNDFKFHHWRKGDDIEKVIGSAKYPAYKMIIQPPRYTDDQIAPFRENIVSLVEKEFSSRFKIEMSSDFTLEVCPKGSGKGEALSCLVPMLGKKFDKIVCVGDNQNDISMIKFADIGYAVDNAIDALKAVADKITVGSDEGVIEHLIKEL